MSSFKCGPIDRGEILRNVPVKVGWILPYVELQANGEFQNFDLAASDGIYLHSVNLKPSERPRKITYSCSCLDTQIAKWNKEEALKFTDMGYLTREVLASKNSYFIQANILEGDVQIFANPEQTKVHIGKNAKEEDLEFLRRLKLIPEDFEISPFKYADINGVKVKVSEISGEWQRLNR